MKLILIILTSLLIAGCGNVQIKVVEKQVLVPIELDQRLFRKCVVPPPPTREHYLSLDISQRETALSLYSKDLMLILDRCGMQIDEIKKVHDAYLIRIRETKS